MTKLSKGQVTKLKVLEAAKDEFAYRGFKQTSLLGVAKKAGVTTGSVYCYFESKEHLYECIVDEIFERFMNVYKNNYKDQIEYIKSTDKSEIFGFVEKRTMDLVDFVYDNYEEILCLLKAPSGTKYYNFKNQIIEEGIEQFILMLEQLKKMGITDVEVDRDVIKYQVEAEANTIFSVIKDVPDREKAMHLLGKIEFFFRSGYMASHGIMK